MNSTIISTGVAEEVQIAAQSSFGSVTSADGTIIGYRQVGTGPGLVIVHGGLRASQHYLRLAEALADAYTVYIPDRRGRGLSGPAGDSYSFTKECEDLDALLQKTGARFVFGHSAGGLIALEAALGLPIRKLSLYEPAVSINGSLPLGWLPAFEHALARNDSVAATVIFFKGLQLSWVSKLPRWLLAPMVYLLLRGDQGREMVELLPTLVRDAREAQRLDSTYRRYQNITAKALLLGGSRSPAYLLDVLPIVAKTIADAQSIVLPRLDHNAPDENAPELVAAALRQFFA
jgi:pimeloyl-ACP methyl ester carboxylesterase